MLWYISKKEVNGSPNNTLLSGILLKCNDVLTNLTVIVTRKLTAIKSQQSLLKRVLVKGGRG